MKARHTLSAFETREEGVDGANLYNNIVLAIDILYERAEAGERMAFLRLNALAIQAVNFAGRGPEEKNDSGLPPWRAAWCDRGRDRPLPNQRAAPGPGSRTRRSAAWG